MTRDSLVGNGREVKDTAYQNKGHVKIWDVGLMNKATQVARHNAGTRVERGIRYVFDQTNKGFTPNGLVIYTHEACYELIPLLVSIHLLYDAYNMMR